MIKKLHYLLLLSISLILFSCSELEVEFKENSLVQGKKTEIVSSMDPTYDSEKLQRSLDNINTFRSMSNTSINWQNWFLSIPIDNGKPDTKAKSLYYESILEGSYSREVSEYFSWNESEEAINLFSQFTGYTLSGYAAKNNDQFSRTEFREFWRGNQEKSDNWSMNEGTHILESTLRVSECENNRDQCEVIVAQINGFENDIDVDDHNNTETVKVRWQSGKLILECYTKPLEGKQQWSTDYLIKKTLGDVGNDIFTIKLKVEDGVLYVALVSKSNNLDTKFSKVYDYVSNGYNYLSYFRSGNYFPYSDNYLDYSNVLMYGLKTIHY